MNETVSLIGRVLVTILKSLSVLMILFSILLLVGQTWSYLYTSDWMAVSFADGLNWFGLESASFLSHIPLTLAMFVLGVLSFRLMSMLGKSEE